MTAEQLRELHERAQPAPWRIEWRHLCGSEEATDDIDRIVDANGDEVVIADSGVYPPRGATAELIVALRNSAPSILEAWCLMDASVVTMMRGLVRCAEFKEQEEGGKIWDDECRRALDDARRLGWGRDRIGVMAGPGGCGGSAGDR